MRHDAESGCRLTAVALQRGRNPHAGGIQDHFFITMTATKTGFLCASVLLLSALTLLSLHWSAFQAWALQSQIQLHRLLVTHLLQINSGQYSAGLWLLAVTFIYGILHAVGPGHGKFIVTTG